MVMMLLFIAAVTIQCDDSVMMDRIQNDYDTALEYAPVLDNVIFSIQYSPENRTEITWRIGNWGQITRIKITLGEGWIDQYLFHELGHVAMIAMYNFRNDYLPDRGDGNYGLVLWKESTEGIALFEGFAVYLQVLFTGKRSPELSGLKASNTAIAIHVAAWLYQMDNATWVFNYFDREHPRSMQDVIDDIFRPITAIKFGSARSR